MKRIVALVGCSLAILLGALGCALAPAAPTAVLAWLAVLSCGYLGGLFLIATSHHSRATFLFTVATAVIARGILITAPAVLEDDVNRYMWDGAVTRAGINPFRFAPQTVYDARIGRVLNLGEDDSKALNQLATLSRTPRLDHAFLGINYPSVPTIYPPVTQLVFASGAAIAPGSVIVLKLIIVGFDLGCALALWLIMVRLKRPRRWLLVYLWNPAIIFSFAGSAHMDSIPLCLLLFAIAAVLSRRPITSGILLGAAASAKLFPLLAWPALRSRLGKSGTIAAGLTVTLSYLLFWIGPHMFDGLRTFATRWQINAPIFGPLAWVVGDRPARITIAIAIIVITFVVAANRPKQPPPVMIAAIAIALSALVLASPAVNPWYVAWLVPFAALGPRLWPALVAVSITVLMSYWRFVDPDSSTGLPWQLIAVQFTIPTLIAIWLMVQPSNIFNFHKNAVTKSADVA